MRKAPGVSLALLLALISCWGGTGPEAGVIAAFHATPLAGDSPLTVAFADRTQDLGNAIVSRHWDFGDGATSAQTNPIHTYSTDGTYKVSLSVSDGFRPEFRYSELVLVGPRPGPCWEPGAVDTGDLYGISVFGQSGAFAVGKTWWGQEGGMALAFDGTDWFIVGESTLPSSGLLDVWATGPASAFAVTAEEAYSFDGTTWNELGCPISDLRAIWASSASDVFVAGVQGSIARYDGSSWVSWFPADGWGLHALWGSGPSDVYAAGFLGKIFHYDGNDWTPATSGVSEDLYDINGSSATDIWAVGANGTIIHCDGSSWSPVATITDRCLWGVWAAAADDVYAVGEEGSVLHYDGSAWTQMEQVTLNALYDVHGTGSTNVIAVGSNGTIIHYGP